MKRVVSFAIVGVFFVTLLASCGSSKQRCDAYGDNFNDTSIELSEDLAQL